MEPDDRLAAPAWATEDIDVVEPDTRWPEQAAYFAGEIRSLLEDWLSSPVVHVGSTAVPGLAAKPIIDLQATAVDPAATVAAKQAALTATSWFFVPRELDQRPWRWFLVRADVAGQHRLAHLHLMQPGEPRWHQQLAFRDTLRDNPALAQNYARLKSAAGSEYAHDREAYTRAKHAFVRRVLDEHY